MKYSFSFVAVLSILFSVTMVFAEPVLPKPDGYVLDEANLLNKEQEQALELRLAQLEKDYTAEYAIALLPNLQGQDLASFANALFREWGLGKKDLNNGILLLVDLENRWLRFEVGYGLEGVIPDALAYQIIEETLTPGFREEAYAKALNTTVDHVALLLSGEILPEPQSKVVNDLGFLFLIGLFLFNGILMALWALVRGLSKTKHWWPGALLGFVFAAVLALFFLKQISFLIVLALGTLSGALLDLLLSTVLQKPIAKYGPKVDGFLERVGWISGLGGGSGGGSGGGFGGGSSGGGGASGSW